MLRTARRTLADVRRMLGRYREVSLRTELDTAVTLLKAGGVTARLVLPAAEDVPESAEEATRAALRREVASLLRDGAPSAPVVIVVGRRDGRAAVEVRADEAAPGRPG